MGIRLDDDVQSGVLGPQLVEEDWRRSRAEGMVGTDLELLFKLRGDAARLLIAFDNGEEVARRRDLVPTHDLDRRRRSTCLT